MDKRIKLDSFDKEYNDSLNKLYGDNTELRGLKWFLDTAHRWAYRPDEHDVVILGAAVPEEFVMAAGAQPHWLIGGSLGSAQWSDCQPFRFGIYLSAERRGLFRFTVHCPADKRQHEKDSLYTKVGGKKDMYS